MRPVLLFSGGVDSTVLAHWLLDKYARFVAITFDYGQPAWEQEAKAAAKWCKAHGQTLKTVRLPLECTAMREDKNGPRIVPARNMTMIAFALNIAQSHNLGHVFLGATGADQRDYPDCRAEWISAMSVVSRYCTNREVRAPFTDLGRTEIIDLGRDLDADLSATWSCYEPVHGKPCGACASCNQ